MGKRKMPLKIWLFWHTGIRIKIPACTMSSLNFLRRDCAPLDVGALSLCTSNTKQHQAQPPWHHASKQKIQDLWLSLRVYRSSSSQNFEGSILGSFQFNALKQATVLWKGYKTDSPALPLEFFKNITFSITQSLDACGCQYWIHHGWCSSNKKGCVSCVITLHGWRTLKIPGTRERQIKWFGPDCLGLKHPWVCLSMNSSLRCEFRGSHTTKKAALSQKLERNFWRWWMNLAKRFPLPDQEKIFKSPSQSLPQAIQDKLKPLEKRSNYPQLLGVSLHEPPPLWLALQPAWRRRTKTVVVAAVATDALRDQCGIEMLYTWCAVLPDFFPFNIARS